jgi:hypothetical protein
VDGVPKIGGAIPAVVKRGVVQLRDIAGEVHEASGVVTMLHIKEVPQFMQSHLGRPFKDLRRSGGRAVAFFRQPERGNKRDFSILSGFAIDVGEDRNEKIDIQDRDDFPAVVKSSVFKVPQNGTGIVLQPFFRKGIHRVGKGRQYFWGEL